MLGSHVNNVFARLGHPDGEQRVANRTVYVWANQSSGAMPIMMPTTTTGWVGRTPVTMTGQQWGMMPVNHACMIRVVVDDEGIVQSYDYRGNEGGCGPYARRLNR